MKYSEVKFGTSEAVFNKLGGIPGVANFLSGKTKVVKSDRNFSTFIILYAGFYNSNDLIKIINKDDQIDINQSENVLSWPPLFQFREKTRLELVVVTPEELGFETMFESCANYENICERASRYGLDKCPAELGMLLSLRHDLKDQFYVVMSDLLRDKKGKKNLLVPWYDSNGKCRLEAWEVEQGKIFYASFKFIFIRHNVEI